ncbi:two-component system phosphate regulon sensor histidine kinase PhoR [Arcticibacter tournemirensis]|uniref:histidine kinase n=1 Tax=Arcticibacter tournemirensis TaxID=699437 RepID=A0A5M9GYS5_9SPHI|nr:HAMP domain-containing sensor histidine kinase [Arcticibacter tournemirensis]KAA8478931.1 HAMP domain-containing histidine kinase [Arcticibacter tournemirensis]TQM49152.1 two-component system phosphate regulon sensor histidine kinase PhoR [Arcticibacter tournemirensis]
MKARKTQYRRNSWLNAGFLVLIALSLIVALVLAHSLIEKYVENEFNTRKIDVLEETLKAYNDFFQNRVPEISFYQGYLDSASAVKYADTVLRKYAFVSRLIFYDTEISNHPVNNAFRVYNFSIAPRAVYQFRRAIPADSILLFKNAGTANISVKGMDEFNKMAVKFSAYIESADTIIIPSSADYVSTFYNVTHNRITFMNIPREEDVRIFKDLMFKELRRSPVFEQDIISFWLNPERLQIRNTHKELYQEISIKPLVYDSLDTNPEFLSTDLPLSGAFADYKLYFSSSRSFLKKEIYRRFIPVAFVILLIYAMLIFLAYLIYRNLNINSRMFKLQYDFINNLTHEFKTPVSVIKIAGNNIKSASSLSEGERFHYGKILDQEADKLNDLMNKLLSFTQIENQSINIKRERIEFEQFLQKLINGYRLKYPDFNIGYKIQKLEFFDTDPVLLASIFQNLIDNAYKYSLPGKKKLDIDVFTEKGNAIFRFTDQGIGIPKEETQNVFKKFYRIQNQYNQQGSVGLGLAFCKELINFMNGEIRLKSKEGVGSEFSVILPL